MSCFFILITWSIYSESDNVLTDCAKTNTEIKIGIIEFNDSPLITKKIILIIARTINTIANIFFIFITSPTLMLYLLSTPPNLACEHTYKLYK